MHIKVHKNEKNEKHHKSDEQLLILYFFELPILIRYKLFCKCIYIYIYIYIYNIKIKKLILVH